MQAKFFQSLSPRLSAPPHYRFDLSRHIDLMKFVKNMMGALSPGASGQSYKKKKPGFPPSDPSAFSMCLARAAALLPSYASSPLALSRPKFGAIFAKCRDFFLISGESRQNMYLGTSAVFLSKFPLLAA
jgi:hypothetical protein